ncbi:hypothetical protein GCM10017688_08420 [Streptomyces ramulosus]
MEVRCPAGSAGASSAAGAGPGTEGPEGWGCGARSVTPSRYAPRVAGRDGPRKRSLNGAAGAEPAVRDGPRDADRR